MCQFAGTSRFEAESTRQVNSPTSRTTAKRLRPSAQRCRRLRWVIGEFRFRNPVRVAARSYPDPRVAAKRGNLGLCYITASRDFHKRFSDLTSASSQETISKEILSL